MIGALARRLHAALLCTLLGATGALAADVEVPLTLDHEFLEHLLRQRLFTGPGETLRLGDDGSGCRYLELTRPALSTRAGRLQLRADAYARLGTPWGAGCLVASHWRGQLEVRQSVAIVDRHALRLQVDDTRVLGADGRPDPVADTVWQWSRPYVAPALETQIVDLQPQLAALREALAAMIGPGGTGVAGSFDVGIARAGATDQGLALTLAVHVPDAPAPAPQPPARALGPKELRALEGPLQHADAFFTNIIKQAAADSALEDARLALLGVLIESRRGLVEILSGTSTGADPARRWFLDTWSRLAPLLRPLAEQAAAQDHVLGYASFVAAGDALAALDRLGPALGLEISAPGLRRMARLVLRGAGDPLEYDERSDPELRRRFGFGAGVDRTGPVLGWIDWLIPPAHAAEGLDPRLVARLNVWVPSRADVDAYLPLVQQVLAHAAARRIAAAELVPAHRPIFERLVLATAWQESCWRQFVAADRKRVPLTSASGDYGIMQVNARVWRGFYDPHALKWDVTANAAAGAEILLHYFEHYALRHGEDRKTGDPHNLARSAYSAYNGGPGAYTRYRRQDAGSYARRVDRAFRDKYRALGEGAAAALVRTCY